MLAYVLLLYSYHVVSYIYQGGILIWIMSCILYLGIDVMYKEVSPMKWLIYLILYLF